jgi:hypothetical protein
MTRDVDQSLLCVTVPAGLRVLAISAPHMKSRSAALCLLYTQAWQGARVVIHLRCGSSTPGFSMHEHTAACIAVMSSQRRHGRGLHSGNAVREVAVRHAYAGPG